jgi:hypothetical protein
VGVGYANLVLSKEEFLQEETNGESNKKQEEDPGTPGCKDLDVRGVPGLSNINDEHCFPIQDIIV